MNSYALLFTLLAIGCDKPQEAPSRTESAAEKPPQQAATVIATVNTVSSEPAAHPTAALKVPEVIGCQHVLIAYRGAKDAPAKVTRSKADALKLAEKIRSEMLAHKEKDFAAFAKEFSEDPGSSDRLGSVGKFKRDRMTPAFSEAAFKLQVNELSPVTLSPFGYHIIKRFE